jgi:anti-sigma-K factor RskA
MKNADEIDNALSAEYALGTLRGGARLRFERRLAQEKALAERVARWQTMLGVLDKNIVPQVPPERVWKKIQLSLPPVKRAPRLGWNTFGWALAAGLAAVALVPYFISKSPDLTPLVVLNGSSAEQGQWIVSADSLRKTLSLTPVRPQNVANSSSLQLWAIPSGSKPVSLGLLKSSRPTLLTVDSVTLSPGTTIAISLEPHGGSPTGQPTGPVVYSGAL